MAEHYVIIGGGQAASQAVQSLRRGQFEGKITLIGDEPFPPYQRPPLSKKYLAGELQRDRLLLRPAAFYDKNQVDMALGVRAVELDPAPARIHLSDGRVVDYDRLLLATGSRVRRLDVPGGALPGIHYVRTVADVDALRPSMTEGSRLVVVGAGYIGLEVAAVAAQAGLRVTVLEASDRVMARVVCPEVSRFFLSRHERAGVEIRCDTAVSRFMGNGSVETVEAADGERFSCDLVVAGIGIEPEVRLAEKAGLRCENGIAVDEHARTEDVRVLAAGDCTSHPSRLLGERVRLESVQNAVEQAKNAAATLLGAPEPYNATPWFWSDQYDVKLQIAGLSRDYDQTVIRSRGEDSFAAFYLRGDRLIAVDAVNSPKEFMLGKQIITAETPVSAEALADAEFDLAGISTR